MNKSSSKSTLNETKHTNNVVSKLRRLKIEENILLQSLKKLDQKRSYDVPESGTNDNIDCKNTIRNLKDSYINIKKLLDEIKVVTSSQELLAELEIDEIKSKVLELETTLRPFNLELSNELNSLKNEEQQLTQQLEEINFKDTNVKKQAKMSVTIFKQNVPSPVQLLMTSPLKCNEVQEFQDFMKNSPNRYGGWNEYHHNIFLKLWQKHFRNKTVREYSDSFVANSEFENFIEESLSKLQGIDRRNLITHMEWFNKYLYFKSKQQTAIDQWKYSRKCMKKNADNNHVHKAVQSESENNRQPKYVRLKKTKPTHKILSKEDIERVMAPTKQWLTRCEDKQKMEQIYNIESLQKLHKPNWRQYL